jgi:hypothetical protein
MFRVPAPPLSKFNACHQPVACFKPQHQSVSTPLMPNVKRDRFPSGKLASTLSVANARRAFFKVRHNASYCIKSHTETNRRCVP